MLYNLLASYGDEILILNLFKYITFRSIGAFVTAFIVTMIALPKLIKYFIRKQKGQPIRDDGPETHLVKQGTPTMGGLAIVFAINISTLLWANLCNVYVWVVLFVLNCYALLGFYDDYLKLSKSNSKGFAGKKKLMVQFVVSILAYLVIKNYTEGINYSQLSFPFFKNLVLDLGAWYIIFASIVIIGASNAVNLTDGLDGLVIVPIMIVAGCFSLIVYLMGNSIFANYLQILHIPDSGELAVLCATIIGSGLGFLWYNAKPAEIFMGDTGSLSLGGALGTISVITKHEIVLSIIGGLFVIEALSVIIQVYYFKLTGGKRIFRMAPIHHHFEKCGWSETKVVVRFWIVAVIFAIVGLSTLKLR